jgi:colanic acid/amylovoran biosynthesis glycosyltransferase
VEQLGCPPAKLHKLPMGLNLDDFVFRQRSLKAGESIRILTVARLVEIKGHDCAIRAVARLRERHTGVRYDIVGDGPLRRQLEQLVIELGLQDAITIHGAQNGAFIRQLMDQAHLALLASVTVEGDQEGQGLVVQEAQAAGLPVVATQHGALPEGMMPGRSGLLVPERDVEALADALNYLIEHPELWPAMGREGRKFVEEHHDARKLSQQLAELLGKAASDYQKRAP